MSETGLDIVHEAYSFACMRCSHAWEQSYDIEHHIDAAGRTVIAYRAGGHLVPSPLTRPTCPRCGGHLVRIMQAGTVSNPLLRWPQTAPGTRPKNRRRPRSSTVRARTEPGAPPSAGQGTADQPPATSTGGEPGGPGVRGSSRAAHDPNHPAPAGAAERTAGPAAEPAPEAPARPSGSPRDDTSSGPAEDADQATRLHHTSPGQPAAEPGQGRHWRPHLPRFLRRERR